MEGMLESRSVVPMEMKMGSHLGCVLAGKKEIDKTKKYVY